MDTAVVSYAAAAFLVGKGHQPLRVELAKVSTARLVFVFADAASVDFMQYKRVLRRLQDLEDEALEAAARQEAR